MILKVAAWLWDWSGREKSVWLCNPLLYNLPYYEWIMKYPKSQIHKMIMDHKVSKEPNTQNDKLGEVNNVKCSNGHSINLKGNALSVKRALGIEESRSNTSHTVKAFNKCQSFSLVRVSHWCLCLRLCSTLLDLLWSHLQRISHHICALLFAHMPNWVLSCPNKCTGMEYFDFHIQYLHFSFSYLLRQSLSLNLELTFLATLLAHKPQRSSCLHLPNAKMLGARDVTQVLILGQPSPEATESAPSPSLTLGQPKVIH